MTIWCELVFQYDTLPTLFQHSLSHSVLESSKDWTGQAELLPMQLCDCLYLPVMHHHNSILQSRHQLRFLWNTLKICFIYPYKNTTKSYSFVVKKKFLIFRAEFVFYKGLLMLHCTTAIEMQTIQKTVKNKVKDF